MHRVYSGMKRNGYTSTEMDAVNYYASCPMCDSGHFNFGRGRDLHCLSCGEEWIPSEKKLVEWIEKDNK